MLRGRHADEVWVDRINEGGSFHRHRPASFLDAQVAYFEGLLAEHRRETSARDRVTTGDVAALIARQKTRNKRRALLDTLDVRASQIVKSADASDDACLGAVATFEEIARAYRRENTSTFWTTRWLVLAMLRAGDYRRAYPLAEKQYAESREAGADYIAKSFAAASALHLYLAAAALDRTTKQLRLPTPKAYAASAHQWDHRGLIPTLARLPAPARAAVAKRLGQAWKAFIKSTS